VLAFVVAATMTAGLGGSTAAAADRARASEAREPAAPAAAGSKAPNRREGAYTTFYVDASVSDRDWPYRAAVAAVDALTGVSAMVYGPCPVERLANVGCITIAEKAIAAPRVYATTLWWSDGRAGIALNPAYRTSLTVAHKRDVIEHELGHAFGLKHADSCASIMYATSDCFFGKTFDGAEKAWLRTQ
jgi:hypothetical protein